jgi:hypothetical protein
MTALPRLLPCLLLLLLTGCDLLGIPDPAKEAAVRDAEGRAIGSACRHAGRALEDCFTLNTSADKASVFAGWKEMNDYMAANNIETVKPQLLPGGLLAARPREEPTAEPAASAPEAAASEAPAPRRRPRSQ